MSGTGTCAARVPEQGIRPGAALWHVCGEPAVSVWVYGCVHEHVKVRATCAEHEPRAGEVGCMECWVAGHDCEMTFRPAVTR